MNNDRPSVHKTGIYHGAVSSMEAEVVSSFRRCLKVPFKKTSKPSQELVAVRQ